MILATATEVSVGSQRGHQGLSSVFGVSLVSHLLLSKINPTLGSRFGSRQSVQSAWLVPSPKAQRTVGSVLGKVTEEINLADIQGEQGWGTPLMSLVSLFKFPHVFWISQRKQLEGKSPKRRKTKIEVLAYTDTLLLFPIPNQGWGNSPVKLTQQVLIF